jgi:hypothetical protein
MLAIGLGLLARRGLAMSLAEWSVGRRGFGALFVFLLMAGEIYTTFSFLGASGWIYGRGAPAFGRGRLRSAPVPRAAAQGTGHHRLGSVLRQGLPCHRRVRELHWAHGLRGRVGRAGLGLDRGGEGPVGPRRGNCAWRLPPAPLLRWLSGDVRGDQPRTPRSAHTPCERSQRLVVRLDRNAHGAGVLHVAAKFRQRLHRRAMGQCFARTPWFCRSTNSSCSSSFLPASRLSCGCLGSPGARPISHCFAS